MSAGKRMRPATPEEREADYIKRRDALNAAIRDGLFSDKQVEERLAALESFQGYPRPVEEQRSTVEIEFTEVDPEALATTTGMTPRTFRKKPVEIQAMHWPGSAALATPVIAWILQNGGTARYHEEVVDELYRGTPFETRTPEHILIDTLEGSMVASVGDWIIRGVQGEFYPCKPDIFEQTYEETKEVEL